MRKSKGNQKIIRLQEANTIVANQQQKPNVCELQLHMPMGADSYSTSESCE